MCVRRGRDQEVGESLPWLPSFAGYSRDDEPVATHRARAERYRFQLRLDFLQTGLSLRGLGWVRREVWSASEFSRSNSRDGDLIGPAPLTNTYAVSAMS